VVRPLGRLPVSPRVVYGISREIRRSLDRGRPLVLAGAAEPVERLRQALAEGGDATALRVVAGHAPSDEELRDAAALVYALGDEQASADDEAALKRAHRKRVPVVCVVPTATPGRVPYVLETDVVPLAPGRPVPLDRIAERLAERAEENAYGLAARLPSLRRAVCRQIIERFSRQNGILGATIFIPGADMPALTLNQVRMVLRIAAAYGEKVDREREVELLTVLGAGFGMRAVARQALAFVPIAGWAVKGGIAYVGTRALGRAAIAYFERGGARRVRSVAGSVRPRS
jgi:uncharacterized protein (DUF697 family)